jgi:hypothetical protein
VARLVENLGRQPALSSTALQSNSDGWLSMAVAEAARGETWPVSWLVKLQVYGNGTMDPWPLHRDHWLNQLKSTHLIGSGGSPTDQ